MATAAAMAVGSVALAGGGVALGGADILVAQNIHRRQIAQDRRHFYAGYTEAVAHHGESYAQAERHHSQQYAIEEAQYWIAEKVYRRLFQQAKMQFAVSTEIARPAQTLSRLVIHGAHSYATAQSRATLYRCGKST